MGAHTVWPSEFSDLKKLEDILQCSICYEYINTCMITPCSHNFCSLCIRKYLQYKTQCPTCFDLIYGSDLRKNRLVDDIVTIYVNIKDRLSFNLRLLAMTQSVKNESKVNSTDSPTTSPVRDKSEKSMKKETQTPKNVKGRKNVVQKLFSEKKKSPEVEEAKDIVVDGIVIPSMFQPQKSPKKNLAKKSEDLSNCPVCNVDVPLKNLNMHLDSCLAASDPDSSRLKRKPEKRDPIPKRVYTMMKDKDLKKCLKDYGLNTAGDRKAMISRISRYVVLYNAECDKEFPRPVSELIKQVEREEKDEKCTNQFFNHPRPAALPPEKKKDPETIEKVNKEYLEINKENFKKLIEAMKQRDGKNIKPLKPLNRIGSDDENEIKPDPLFDQPSTSKQNCDMDQKTDTISLDSDTDPDIIEKTPVKVEAEVYKEPLHRLIDWKKTEVLDEEADCVVVEQPDNSAAVVTVEDESMDSYESVFNNSTRSDLSKTPTSNLSMSARKKAKKKVTPNKSPGSSKLGERLDEIFDEVEGDSKEEPKLLNGNHSKEDEVEDDSTEEEKEDIEDEEEDTEEEEEDDDDDDEDEDCNMKTPSRKSKRASPVISPIKTRSAKRKSQADEEKSASKTGPYRRKRVKPSTSPDIRSVSPEF